MRTNVCASCVWPKKNLPIAALCRDCDCGLWAVRAIHPILPVAMKIGKCENWKKKNEFWSLSSSTSSPHTVTQHTHTHVAVRSIVFRWSYKIHNLSVYKCRVWRRTSDTFGVWCSPCTERESTSNHLPAAPSPTHSHTCTLHGARHMNVSVCVARTYGNLLLSRCCLCALADIFQIYTYLRCYVRIVCLHCCEIRLRCLFQVRFSFFLLLLLRFSSVAAHFFSRRALWEMCDAFVGAGKCWWPDGHPKKKSTKILLKMRSVAHHFAIQSRCSIAAGRR